MDELKTSTYYSLFLSLSEQTEVLVPEDQISSSSNETLGIHMLFHSSIFPKSLIVSSFSNNIIAVNSAHKQT